MTSLSSRKISSRQLYLFLSCITPVGKLVIMPARLANYAGSDLLLPALVQILLQSAAIFCVLLLARKGRSFYELLCATFGKIGARIIILIFSAFLFYASFVPLLEQKTFVQGTFYDTIPSLVAFAPFFLLCAFLCSKPLISYGRTWDILAPIAIVGLLGILLLSFSQADYGAMLPIGAEGAKNFFKGTAFSFCWFFDAPMLLFLLGKFDYEKGMALKGSLYYLLGGFFVLLFITIFYGVFEQTATNQIFGFSKTSKYFSGMTVLGRVDFIFIYALAFVMIFYTSLPLQAGIEGILQAFGRKKYLPTILSIGLNVVLVILIAIFDYEFGNVLHFVSEKAFFIFPLFSILLPCFALILGRKQHERA